MTSCFGCQIGAIVMRFLSCEDSLFWVICVGFLMCF
ncbi:LOW QUALITY PROTEIN: hypothetical protein TorRG33x02_221550 [Trema orientale]|uniref:Uncharacterized protein n=1 Tax=Trema orientale TaxID=63057 RepID=A0A2P5E914_TREOI|nr:LOW QUALITY PROTEIN: hypothetical protein TorRG33x02_221550 [Trema orientale]